MIDETTHSIDRVMTPHGMKQFDSVRHLHRQYWVELHFSDESSLKCSFYHRIKTPASWSFAINLLVGEPVMTDGGLTVLHNKIIHYSDIDLYDLIDVESHEYYTNGILSHNCEFLGASDTLIDKSKLGVLVPRKPIMEILPAEKGDIRHIGFSMFHKVIKEKKTEHASEQAHQYVLIVDTSEGKGQDYTAMVCIDITTKPYEVAATYRNNLISPMAVPDIIKDIGEYYNDAYVLIEVKNDGKTVANVLWQHIEYENMLKTTTVKKRQKLSFTHGRGGALGVDTSAQVKQIGCSNLKTLVENDQIIVNDVEIISELSRFGRAGSSYKAKSGNDDLVMCLVLFAWCTTQSLFESLADRNLYQSFKEHHKEEYSLPLAKLLGDFHDDGWQKVKSW